MDFKKEQLRLTQIKTLDWLKSEPKATDMITVYYNDYCGEHYHSLYCALVPLSEKNRVLSNFSWDLVHGKGLPDSVVYHENGEEIVEYLRFGDDDGIEPLIIDREFYGIKKDYKEICEEFRLFHRLYHDQKNNHYLKISDDGNETLIAKVEENKIEIRAKEIRQFLSVKEMYLSLQFDYREHSKASLKDLNMEESSCTEGLEELMCWSHAYGDFRGLSDNKAFTRLVGKRLINPLPKSKCGLYGFTKRTPKKHIDFIIDVDEFGDEILHSSDPDLLANNFGANPNSPHYLTPVDFRKEVLEKYYQQPSKYSVDDSSLSCGSLWGIQIDNHHDEKVCVWLGDLGRDLPNDEKLHWRSYNIPPKGGVSKTYFKRQILAQFTDSDRPEHLFQQRYNKLQKLCDKKSSAQLLLPLNDEDKHHFDCIRTPATNEQREFDELILSLTKILIDSLNEKYLNSFIPSDIEKNIKGSISRLEQALISLDCQDFENQISFLRKLQNIRSSSTAHRKGSNYRKIANELGIETDDLKSIFKSILSDSLSFLEYLILITENGKFQKS